MLSFTSCDNDDDPVVDEIAGTWGNEADVTVNGQVFNSLWQWEFKANNTGDYSYTVNDSVYESSAFSWEKKDSTYGIDYTSADMTDVEVYMESGSGMTILSTIDEEMLGMKVE